MLFVPFRLTIFCDFETTDVISHHVLLSYLFSIPSRLMFVIVTLDGKYCPRREGIFRNFRWVRYILTSFCIARLICSFSAIGSFTFLSYRGRPRRSFFLTYFLRCASINHRRHPPPSILVYVSSINSSTRLLAFSALIFLSMPPPQPSASNSDPIQSDAHRAYDTGMDSRGFILVDGARVYCMRRRRQVWMSLHPEASRRTEVGERELG